MVVAPSSGVAGITRGKSFAGFAGFAGFACGLFICCGVSKRMVETVGWCVACRVDQHLAVKPRGYSRYDRC